MLSEDRMQEPQPVTAPVIRKITARDIADSVSQGLADFRAHPGIGLAVGLAFALGGMLVVGSVFLLGAPWLAYPCRPASCSSSVRGPCAL